MELRHLLGGATAIAGPGGLPGVVRNIYRHRRPGDIDWIGRLEAAFAEEMSADQARPTSWTSRRSRR